MKRILTVLFLLAVPGTAQTAPPGRAWTPVEALGADGFDYILAPRLELDSLGQPALIATAASLASFTTAGIGFNWADSGWRTSWQLGHGEPLFFPPVPAPPEEQYLVYGGGSVATSESLYFARLGEKVPGPIETIGRKPPGETRYAAAVGASQRWAGVYDGATSKRTRLFRALREGVWREAVRIEGGIRGLALAALDDSSALVLLDNDFAQPMRWGFLRGDNWIPGSQTIGTEISASPVLRAAGPNSYWAAWATADSTIPLQRFQDGGWLTPETLRCAYSSGGYGKFSQAPDLSRDSGERPVVVWTYQFFGRGGVCVCVPSGAEYPVGEEISASIDANSTASVARDRFGDVWVAWSDGFFNPIRWTHTYVTTTSSTPRVRIKGGHPRLEWTLSAPSPDSWWAVVRQVGSGDPETVARLRAGADVAMSWTDDTQEVSQLRSQALRYRIRRESVDSRYAWESAPGVWPQGRHQLHARILSPNPVGDTIQLEVESSTPSLATVTVYDLAGRAVLRENLRVAPEGMSMVQVRLDRASLAPGVYFAKVRDASGLASQGMKFVVVR
ncbi:MAG: T9SS type A sorting domain-containing protein [Candidatus Eiseniibacteriota bacterium]